MAKVEPTVNSQQAMQLLTQARDFGFDLSDDFLSSDLPSQFPTWAALKQHLLTSDFRKVSCLRPYFPADLTGAQVTTKLTQKVVLQVSSVVNLSQPSKRKFEDSHPRTLHIQLTDGHSKVNAIELDDIPQIKASTAPGSKVLYLGGEAVKGKLLLTPQNCQYLGGEVAFLLEAHLANINAQKFRDLEAGSKTKAAQVSMGVSAPPKFELKLTLPTPAAPSSSSSSIPANNNAVKSNKKEKQEHEQQKDNNTQGNKKGPKHLGGTEHGGKKQHEQPPPAAAIDKKEKHNINDNNSRNQHQKPEPGKDDRRPRVPTPSNAASESAHRDNNNRNDKHGGDSKQQQRGRQDQRTDVGEVNDKLQQMNVRDDRPMHRADRKPRDAKPATSEPTPPVAKDDRTAKTTRIDKGQARSLISASLGIKEADNNQQQRSRREHRPSATIDPTPEPVISAPKPATTKAEPAAVIPPPAPERSGPVFEKRGKGPTVAEEEQDMSYGDRGRGGRGGRGRGRRGREPQEEYSRPSGNTIDLSALVTAKVGSGWTCSLCTFENHAALKNCEMCNTPKK